MRLTEALARFVVQLEADGRSPHTVRQRRRHVLLLHAWLVAEGRSTRVHAIDHQVVAEFLCSPAARNTSDGRAKKAVSTNGLRSSLRVFFAYLHRAGITPIDAARLVRHARCSPPPPRALTEDEQDRLLDVLRAAKGPDGERDHALFGLLLATGLRLGSAIGIDVEDVDLDAGEVYVRKAKNDRPDRVFLSHEIREHLRAFVGDRRSGPLFRARDGDRVSDRHMQRRFREYVERAGIERHASPHALRHSFAFDLYRKTGDLALVKHALHHRSIASTLTYARCDDDRLRRVLGA